MIKNQIRTVRLSSGQSCKLDKILKAENMETISDFVRKSIDDYIFEVQPEIKPEPVIEVPKEPAVEVKVEEQAPAPAVLGKYDISIEDLSLKIEGMDNKDIARFALVAIHKLDMELQPELFQANERIDYLRHTHDKYLMLLDFYKDKLTSEDIAHVDRGIHSKFPSVLSELDKFHNIRIRPIMFMIREYMLPLRKMEGFNTKLFLKTKLFYEKFGEEFNHADNSITKYFNDRMRVYTGLQQISTEKLLDIVLDDVKYKAYLEKLVEGAYEV